jgi:hypothetical protein
VLGGEPSGGAGFGTWASLLTSLAEGGTTCWSSFVARGATGRGRVSGSSVNGVDGGGAEVVSDRARSSASE